VTVGKLYRVSFDWTQKQGGGRFYVGTSIGSAGLLVGALNPGSGQVLYFVATAATIYISLGDSSVGVGTVNIYDNISIFEVAEATVDLSSGAWVRGSIENKTITNPFFAIKLATSADAVDVAIADLENGAFITSPIPTVASQVTRAADQISILTSAFPYSATESTLAVDWQGPVSLTQDVVWIANGLSESLAIYVTGANIAGWCRDGGVTQATPASAGSGVLRNKAAFAAKLDDFAISVNGSAAVTDTSGTMPTPTELKLNPRMISGLTGNLHIKRLAYYASRKTNAELQVLST
jgi:hypothetical protein